MIFFAQAAADIESRALLALIIISLQLESTGSNSFHRPAYQKSRYPCKHRHIMYILNCMLFHSISISVKISDDFRNLGF